MRYFYDAEFAENGETIRLISIGFVREDNEELYLINGEFPLDLYADPEWAWLAENVAPHLPLTYSEKFGWEWDENNSEYLTHMWGREGMAARINAFFAQDTSPVELWADYGAFDYVALAQIFGRMIHKPAWMPDYTNDLRQMLRSHQIDPKMLPPHTGRRHHALDDARHLKQCFERAMSRARTPGWSVGRPRRANTWLP